MRVAASRVGKAAQEEEEKLKLVLKCLRGHDVGHDNASCITGTTSDMHTAGSTSRDVLLDIAPIPLHDDFLLHQRSNTHQLISAPYDATSLPRITPRLAQLIVW